MVNQGGADYAAIARGAGIASARHHRQARRARTGRCRRSPPRPVRHFMRLRVEAETGFLRTPPVTYEGPEMKYRFGRALEKKLGIKVFGPQGY